MLMEPKTEAGNYGFTQTYKSEQEGQPPRFDSSSLT